MQTTAFQYPVNLRNAMITRASGLVMYTGVSESGTDIIQGNLLITGSDKDGADLPTSAFVPSAVYGVVPIDNKLGREVNTNLIRYETSDPVPLVQKGFIALRVSDAIAKNQNLYFVHTAGGASAIHTYRSDADTDKASVVPVKALESGSSGDIIECYVDVFAQVGNI